MDCEQALEAISAALDGELSQTEQAALSEHLLRYEECRALAEDMRSLSAMLDASDQAPPPELSRSVMEAVATEKKAVRVTPQTRRYRPWLRTAAVVFALCVCLGGVKLWLSNGVRSDSNLSGGIAPSAAEPMPSSMPQGPALYSFDAAENGFNSCDADGSDFQAADNELTSPESPAEPGAPAPACEDNVTGCNPGEPANGSGSVSPEDALELVFAYLGGYEEYPEARPRTNTIYGFDSPAYYLKTVENDFGRYEYCLDHTGLSANGLYYQFRLYEDVTDYSPDGFDHTATSNWFAVSLDGAELLPQFPIGGGDDETWQAYFEAYEAATAGD